MGNPSREKLLARQAALEAEREAVLARLRANQAKLAGQNRKEDMRRKILLGSFYLARAKNDERANAAMLKDLAGYLTRDDDRKLFGLPPLPEQPAMVVPQSPPVVDIPDASALPHEGVPLATAH